MTDSPAAEGAVTHGAVAADALTGIGAHGGKKTDGGTAAAVAGATGVGGGRKKSGVRKRYGRHRCEIRAKSRPHATACMAAWHFTASPLYRQLYRYNAARFMHYTSRCALAYIACCLSTVYASYLRLHWSQISVTSGTQVIQVRNLIIRKCIYRTMNHTVAIPPGMVSQKYQKFGQPG